MNRLLIYKYIDKLKKDDIKEFALKQNIILNNQEINIIYDYLKNKTETIFDDPLNVIREIKDKVNIPTYNKLLELYNEYKNIIK